MSIYIIIFFNKIKPKKKMKNIFNSQMCIIQVSDFFFSFMLYDFSNDNVNIVSFFIYIYITL